MSLPTKAVMEPIIWGTLITFVGTELSFPKFLDWDCGRPFGSSIGFVYITVYNATITTSYYVNKRQRPY